jgi:hypothetical protein
LLRVERLPAPQPDGARGVRAARHADGVEIVRDLGEVQRSQRVGRRDHAVEHAFRERRIHLAHGHVDGIGAEAAQDLEQFGRRAQAQPLQVGESVHRAVARDDAGQVAALDGEHWRPSSSRANCGSACSRQRYSPTCCGIDVSPA